MIINDDAELDLLVANGKLDSQDAEQVRIFSEFLRYAGGPRGPGTRAQMRWLAAFLRTERGARFFLGTQAQDWRGESYPIAERLERAAGRRS